MTCWLTYHKHWDRKRQDAKPIYGSAGHIIDMPHAIEFVLACCAEFRIPEPERAAHEVRLLSNHPGKKIHWLHESQGSIIVPTPVGLPI